MKSSKCHPGVPLYCKGLCKPCYMRKYSKDHPNRKRYFIEYTKEYRRKHPSYRRDHYKKGSHAKSRYGISSEEYNSRRDKKLKDGDLCGLCNKPLGKVRAHLDHDHSTNKLRDFIHRNCNLAIGLLEDDPNLCRLAAEYIEKYKE